MSEKGPTKRQEMLRSSFDAIYGKKEPREYRLDVRMPRAMAAKLEAMVMDFKRQGVQTSKSEVVVTIVKQFFDSIPEDG